jgi:colanic acid/amylovoran biosynthesis glycosyltransferase
MRIAYFTGEFPRATDTFIQREVAALRARDVEVFTFAVRQPKANQITNAAQEQALQTTTYLLPPAIRVLLWAHLSLFLTSPLRYLKALGLAWQTHQPGIKGTLYQGIYFLEAGLLAYYIRRQQIQHLHNHFGDSSCTVAMLASALGGFSYSFTLHGPGIFFEPLRWRLDEKIRRAAFVNCISHFCRSQAMVFAPPAKWHDLQIIHCGVDPALFTPVQHQENGYRLLYVGRLAAAKGLPILLTSLAKLKQTYPQIQLSVVGDGPDRALLDAQVKDLDLENQVTFLGYQSPEAIRQYLAQSDVFVMSSFAEGVPVVLMEAMAAGLPVVATQIAGVSELVESGVSGYLVPPSDPVRLSRCLEQLLSEPILRQQMGAAGREKVCQDFNLHREAEKLCTLMQTRLQPMPAAPNSASNSESKLDLDSDYAEFTVRSAIQATNHLEINLKGTRS